MINKFVEADGVYRYDNGHNISLVKVNGTNKNLLLIK
jgi:hypothetical protein